MNLSLQRCLSLYGLEEAEPVLLEDTTNRVYRIPVPGSAGFVLRLQAKSQRSKEALHEELRWLSALQQDTDLLVPAPMPARDGSLIQEVAVPGEPIPRYGVLFRWVPGEFRDESLTFQDVQRVGAFMAQLQDHGDRFVLSLDVPPARRALFCDVSAWTDPPHNVRTVFSPEELAVFAEAARRVQAMVQELGEGRDVFGFIHADLHQWNYLFQGRDVGAIDFEDCGWGYYAYDIAVTLSYLEAPLQDALLAGYQSVRPLPPRFAESLNIFLAARVLVMVSWILSWPQPSQRSWGPDYLQHAVGRLRSLLGLTPA